MKQLIADMRLPEYRYKQLLDAVFLQGIMRFEDMKLLPKRCAKSWWSSLVKLLWRSRRSIMRNQCKLTRCCLNCRTETVWKRWVCFIKRAGTPFAFHLKAVAASVVSLRNRDFGITQKLDCGWNYRPNPIFYATRMQYQQYLFYGNGRAVR